MIETPEEISSYDARQHFGDVIARVAYQGQHVTITRNGKPMAVMVSPDWYHQHQDAPEDR